jgi:hypothetical protein
VLLTVKSNQKTLCRQIQSQFQGKRYIPHAASDQEKRHGRDTLWEFRAKEAPEHIKENWLGSAWIVEVLTTTTTRRGTLGTAPQVPLSHAPVAPGTSCQDSQSRS